MDVNRQDIAHDRLVALVKELAIPRNRRRVIRRLVDVAQEARAICSATAPPPGGLYNALARLDEEVEID